MELARSGSRLVRVVVSTVLTASAVVTVGTSTAPPVAAGAPLGSASDASCTAQAIGPAGDVYVVCDLSTSASAVDLATLPAFVAESDAPVWIQAWGGRGGNGAPLNIAGGNTPGPGGAAGFSQLVTSLAEYESAFGTTVLHYAVAGPPVNRYDGDAAAGSGGASTLLTTVDPTQTALDLDTNVVAVAGGGGGGSFTGSPVSGGRGGIALSNASGAPATKGEGPNGGGAGGGGTGGVAPTVPPFTDSGFSNQRGVAGADGLGGIGGTLQGLPGIEWLNVSDLKAALDGAGAGGVSVDGGTGQHAAGGGGGGWGGGASGSFVLDQSSGGTLSIEASSGGGGGSFVAASSVTDPNAPTTAPDPPGGVNHGAVRVATKLNFETTFCREDVLAGQEGFRCIVPFNWQFQLPEAFTGPEWLVTLQALGGRGGNGGNGGRAQTTRTTTGLAGTTLYAWVGAQGVESASHGGGGGGATVLSTMPDPFLGEQDGKLSPHLLLVAGGGGGGTALNPCIDQGSDQPFKGGRGGVAVSKGAGVRGNGGNGQSLGGQGATHSNAVWSGGGGGSGAGNSGGSGLSGLTFEGGYGGDQTSSRAATVSSSLASTPTTNGTTAVSPAGAGGSGTCQGGGGGAGAGGGGGGAGGSGSADNQITQGGGGGGGGSFAGASDVTSNFPSFAEKWLTLSDQTSGQISLFFFQVSAGPPPAPANGATIDTVRPTLELSQSRSGSFSYRLKDETAGKTYLASPLTTNERWTIPTGGFLTPGHTYSWEIVNADGAVVQSKRTFTVDPSTGAEASGVTMEFRSMSPYADSSSPEWAIPESGQKVPRTPGDDSLWTSSTPGKCVSPGQMEPNCYEYSGSVDKPDNKSEYFTTSTAVQATTNPGAVNMQFSAFDPFGLGVSALFTLQITGTITVPVTDTYRFGVNAFGGTTFTLTDPSGANLGQAAIDTWGQLGDCDYTLTRNLPYEEGWGELASEYAALGCVNDNGVVAAPGGVALTAGVEYSFEMQGFMAYQPGPFQLLYTSPLFARTMTPVPGAWLTTTGLPGPPITDPSEPPDTMPGPSTSVPPDTTPAPTTPPSAPPPDATPTTLAPTLPATGAAPTTLPATVLALVLVTLGGALLALRRRT